MTNDQNSIATSLSLKIGLSAFDGGDRDWLAKTYAVSLEDVDRSWLQCREWLSEHFAKLDVRDYTLLDEDALKQRLDDSLRLLIDWREQAIQTERFAAAAHAEHSDEHTQPNETDRSDPSNNEATPT